ncbi:MAG: glycosyltransferase [Sphingomonadaceae bacterium]|uniref:glycosyltransferase n=1 Tax=Thermaurantiacus sp. TaxID=2820283 RepID=UPI00298F2086|nr:glycosyltransferase [Thermaurantiacus sp.]MCS6987719.1 glycosyltransferase [Sphingomonadaceae bacterium]MDW8415061.1 glycosyltransferase [Thermaurantiacus sp.]
MAVDVPSATLFLTLLLREGLWLTGVLVLANALDDLAVDLLWPWARVWAALRPPPRPARPLRYAILVPAWQEAQVIGPMLRHLVQALGDRDARVHVGVYPNDPATAAAAGAVPDPRIRIVVTDRPGPTTKADCLNQLWRSVQAAEAAEGRAVDAIVLHDAEDVVDGAQFDLFDSLLPRHAMVQIPVIPVVESWGAFVAGHYLDEFAVTHGRDLVVRSALGAPLPSAGVGTALRRDAVEALARASGDPFDPASLTEDYELGIRLHALGRPTTFARVRAGGRLVAVRECFPDRLDAAVRQKARWLYGIGLAGLDRLGWPQGWVARWMLWRDRKSLVVAWVAVAGYALLALAAAASLLGRSSDLAVDPISLLLQRDPGLTVLLGLTGVALAWRLLVRFVATWRTAGFVQGLLSIPRAPIANLVNAVAAVHAIGVYRQAVEHGRPPPWRKTAHRFPDRQAASA